MQVRALRASRGLPGYEGDCHGSRRRPAPTRRARRARSRAWACWALASGRPPHREERAGGAVSALAPAPRARRGILACAGGSHAPRAPPAPSRRAHRARARARVRLEGFGCAARPAAVQRDPRAGGARARPDAGRGSTCSRDPPSHAPHARRARGGRARASRWGLGGGIQRTARLDPVLWAPRPSGVLG